VNGEDIKWLEKLWGQHNKDQQRYLDDKFNVVNNKLDTRAQNCKDCRKCLDEDIEELDEKIEGVSASTTKKIVFGSIGAVSTSLILWTAYGAGAINYVIRFVKFIF
jgi:hypothetical protein